jgi:signal transduction histidine kinase
LTWEIAATELALGTSAHRAVRSSTAAAAVACAALAAGTIAVAVAPGLRFAIYAPSLDNALLTVATLVSAAVAALSYSRFREHGGVDGLFEASAFFVLAVVNLANELAIVTGLDETLGLALTRPGQLPLYYWAGARLISSTLLLLGALAVTRRIRFVGLRPRLVLLLPAILFGFSCLILWLVRDRIPVLVSEEVLHELADVSSSGLLLPGINPGILVLDGTAGILLMSSAFAYARADHTAGSIPRRYLAVGLVIAAFSQVHYVLYPAVYSGLVTTGDVLRIASYLVLAAGIQAGARQDLHALRSANARLTIFAAAEADRTTMAERARLARELHDGLAQELWTAKLEFDRLATDLDAEGPETREQLHRVGTALDEALHEARDAVEALRSDFDAGVSLANSLPRRLDDFAERTGYPIDLEADQPMPIVPGVIAAEIMRILDEALHNIHKHADATRIRVRVIVRDGVLAVAVDDNGRGFDPGAVSAGHGLVGMRERAALVGGQLVIRSAPGDGTSIELRLPGHRFQP